MKLGKESESNIENENKTEGNHKDHHVKTIHEQGWHACQFCEFKTRYIIEFLKFLKIGNF